jgi:hypothetical protein
MRTLIVLIVLLIGALAGGCAVDLLAVRGGEMLQLRVKPQAQTAEDNPSN